MFNLSSISGYAPLQRKGNGKMQGFNCHFWCLGHEIKVEWEFLEVAGLFRGKREELMYWKLLEFVPAKQKNPACWLPKEMPPSTSGYLSNTVIGSSFSLSLPIPWKAQTRGLLTTVTVIGVTKTKEIKTTNCIYIKTHVVASHACSLWRNFFYSLVGHQST